MVEAKPDNQKVKPIVVQLHQETLEWIKVSFASGERSRWIEEAILEKKARKK
jgi:hypothetical protein